MLFQGNRLLVGVTRVVFLVTTLSVGVTAQAHKVSKSDLKGDVKECWVEANELRSQPT